MENHLKVKNQPIQRLKAGPKDKNQPFIEKPFAQSMYQFGMFMINYYSRVRKDLKIDYDSFMIIQTCVVHTVYQFGKKIENSSVSYEELEEEWGKLTKTDTPEKEKFGKHISSNKNKLTISSICLVTNQPKETVRRKTSRLVKKNILKISNRNGINLGSQYGKIFKDFVPITAQEVAKLVKFWDKKGILKNIIKL